jgi:hypothetical protein
MQAPRLLGVTAFAFVCAACAGAPAEVASAPPAATSSGARAPAPKTRGDEVASLPVYDAAGNASVCAPPKPGCPEAKPDPDFLDHCRLAGFQVRQCGCEQRCSGNVAAATRHYDAAGNPRECPPARADCTPPPAPASFQDACAEKGYRLDTCGCEWLCSGNPKK